MFTKSLSLLLCLTSLTLAAEPLTEVPFTQVQFHDQFWSPRLETNRTVTIPHCFKMCESTGRIDNFSKAAGLMPGPFRGIFYDDSDVYKAIEGASYSLATHPDPDLDTYLDSLISKIAAAQRPDGYLNTFYTLTGLDHRYTDLAHHHELYCAGHLIEAAVAHHRATGKTSLLNVAIKFADQIADTFGPTKRHDVPGHEEIELALIKLSADTGNPKYRDLAQFFLSQRGDPAGHKLYGFYFQDHTPILNQTTPTGHAVRQTYLLCAETDLASTNPAYLPTLDAMWDNLVHKRMYLTGGIGSRAAGESFGSDYELPNDTAYAETCAAIGNALWQHRMNLLHADAKYADTFEQILYNGLLSGVSLSGDHFFYTNPLSSSGDHHRQEWFGTACCPVNLLRFLPSLPGYVYATNNSDTIYVNLFVASDSTITLPQSTIKIAQETQYPWNGLIALIVRPDTPNPTFSLNLRVPSWSENAIILVNDKPAPYTLDHGYAHLTRQWGPADVVKLILPLTPRRMPANPHITADKDKVAISYGPLIYCAESADQPTLNLSALTLLPSTPITTSSNSAIPNITTLKTTTTSNTPLTLIPYYAWDNRTPGPMSVWLPESPTTDAKSSLNSPGPLTR
jgi:hypothetical protein